MKNIFEDSLKTYEGMEQVNDAWEYSERMYNLAMRGDFRKESAEYFFHELRNCYRNEYGLVDICPNIETIREAIKNDRFGDFKEEFFEKYGLNIENPRGF